MIPIALMENFGRETFISSDEIRNMIKGLYLHGHAYYYNVEGKMPVQRQSLKSFFSLQSPG